MLHYWLMWIPESRKHHFSRCWMHFELSCGQWLPLFQFHALALIIWAVVMVLCFVLGVDASERVITFVSAAIQRVLTNIQVFTLVPLCQLLWNLSFTLHWWNHERLNGWDATLSNHPSVIQNLSTNSCQQYMRMLMPVILHQFCMYIVAYAVSSAANKINT